MRWRTIFVLFTILLVTAVFVSVVKNYSFMVARLKPLSVSPARGTTLRVSHKPLTTVPTRDPTTRRTTTKVPRSTLVTSTASPATRGRTLRLIKDFLDNIKKLSMTSHQRVAFLKTVKVFDHFWRRTHNKTYFLYAGTLLGAYRHSDFVPWDDDFDIVINLKDLPFLVDAGKKSSVFTTVVTRSSLTKFYLNDPNMSKPAYLWRWPFIDVWHFQERGRDLHHEGLVTPKRDVFPLIEMPFGDQMLPAPRCPLKMIVQILGPHCRENCYASHYSHQLERERREGRKSIPCQHLKNIFSFTEWQRLNTTHVREWILPPTGERTRGHVVRMSKC